MKRVVAQGDMRPMAGRREAMDDLRSILSGRADLYAQADLTYDTGGKALGDAFFELRSKLNFGIFADELMLRAADDGIHAR